ncbi:hypothetical protein AB7813_03660 [Tardiphaga sp. 20_F10_N6_6]|uniref:hypothetical protein n=1 Tax=Tardiphaga sp. 20_F10_N6_6 TaxID=3240788 RepID=UPI003F8C4B6F
MWQASVLADRRLTPATKTLLQRISLHKNFKTGQCNPSYQTLADGTGQQITAIPKQIKAGEQAGYIRRVSTKGRHSNSYELSLPTDHPTIAGETGLTAHRRTGSTSDSSTRLKEINPVRPFTSTTYEQPSEPPTAIHTNTEVLNKEENREGYLFLPMPPTCGVDVASDSFFKRFYAAYPRKKAPGDAELALGQVLKKKQATEAEIMAGVARLVEHFSRRPPTDRKYIPYPARWLRSRAWADELEEPRSFQSPIGMNDPSIAGFNRRPT